eukprot:1042197-Amphidinium_carterae.1
MDGIPLPQLETETRSSIGNVIIIYKRHNRDIAVLPPFTIFLYLWNSSKKHNPSVNVWMRTRIEGLITTALRHHSVLLVQTSPRMLQTLSPNVSAEVTA